MTRSLKIEPEAEAELAEAYRWYEKLQTGLGREFLERVEAVFERITAAPQLHAVVHKSIRQALVKRFPYVVCYIWEGDRIDVVAVFHGHRDPAGWQSRIEIE